MKIGGRLRQLRPTITSREAAAATRSMNKTSTAPAASGPMIAEMQTAMRPVIHAATKTAKGPP